MPNCVEVLWWWLSHKKNQKAAEKNLTVYLLLFMSYINDEDICFATLLFLLITMHYHFTWHFEMTGMDNLSYLLLLTYSCAIWLLNVLMILWVIWYIVLVCILPHSHLSLIIFGMKQESPRNITLVGDFYHQFFFGVSRWHESWLPLRWTWL